MNRLRILIENIVREYLCEEGRFAGSPTPFNSRAHRERNVANPIIGHGNGSHSNQDVVSQVSTVDHNGAKFVSGCHYVVSDDKIRQYKQVNFGNENLKSTMDFFGEGAKGEIELRREIDRLNGAAKRNRRPLKWRTIIPKEKAAISRRSGHMLYTFWEFSLNGGNSWYILIPNAVEKMKPSNFSM